MQQANANSNDYKEFENQKLEKFPDAVGLLNNMAFALTADAIDLCFD